MNISITSDPIIYSLFLAVSIMLVGLVSPGPNFILVVQNTLSKNYNTGIITASGIVLVDVIYATIGYIGISTVLSETSEIMNFMKIAGGGYLLCLGYNMVKNEAKNLELEPINAVSLNRLSYYFKVGFFTCLANPKTIILYGSIFTIAYNQDNPGWVKILILGSLVLLSMLWHYGIAFIFSRRVFSNFYSAYYRIVEKIFGIVIILFGMHFILSNLL